MNKETFEKAKELNYSIKKIKDAILEISHKQEVQIGTNKINFTPEDINELLTLLDSILKRKEKEFEAL